MGDQGAIKFLRARIDSLKPGDSRTFIRIVTDLFQQGHRKLKIGSHSRHRSTFHIAEMGTLCQPVTGDGVTDEGISGGQMRNRKTPGHRQSPHIGEGPSDHLGDELTGEIMLKNPPNLIHTADPIAEGAGGSDIDDAIG